jgi:hypothetical protein
VEACIDIIVRAAKDRFGSADRGSEHE